MLALEITFLTLQTIVVLFLLFHDWVPLGRLNNLTAIRGQDSVVRSVLVTLLPGAPAALALFFCAKYFGEPYPDWLEMLLWITYGLLVIGLLRAWWIPYLFGTDPARAARYQIIFADTHSFLPKRNGMAPDTLHTCFHIAAVATMVVLFMRDRLTSL
jgi:hypothetical protein